MKYLLLILFLSACYPIVYPNHLYLEEDGGTLCQGSRAWNEQNICGSDNTLGQCIKAINGPYTLTSLSTCGRCSHQIYASIKHSITTEFIPVPFQGSIDLKKDEALYIGTDGFNSVKDSMNCYLTWSGYAIKGN